MVKVSMRLTLATADRKRGMWGPEDKGEPGAAPGSDGEMRHLPFVAKNADAQVGRIVDALEDKGQLDETLIVVTADHAAQTGKRFHGVLAPGVTNPLCTPRTPPPAGQATGIRSDCNWYLGTDADEHYDEPSPAVEGLEQALGGNLAFSYQARKSARGSRTPRSTRSARRPRPCSTAGCRRELPPQRGTGQLSALRHEADEQCRAHVVRAPRPGARRHDGGPERARRGGPHPHGHHLRRHGRPRRRERAGPAHTDGVLWSRRGIAGLEPPATARRRGADDPGCDGGQLRPERPGRRRGGALGALAQLHDLGSRLAGAQALQDGVCALAEQDDIAELDLLVAADHVR